jgi:flagellar hook-length control protein FliK
MNLFDIQGGYLTQFSGLNILVNRIPENALQDFYSYLLSVLNSSSESTFMLSHEDLVPNTIFEDKFLDKGFERSLEEGIKKNDNIEPESKHEMLLIVDPGLFIIQAIDNPGIEKLKTLFTNAFYKSDNNSNSDSDFVKSSSSNDIENIPAELDISNIGISNQISFKDLLSLPNTISSSKDNIEEFLEKYEINKPINTIQVKSTVREDLEKTQRVNQKEAKSTDFSGSIIDTKNIGKNDTPFSIEVAEKSYKIIPEVTNKELRNLKDDNKSKTLSDKDLLSQRTNYSVLKSSQSSGQLPFEQNSRLTDVNNEVILEKQYILRETDGIDGDIKINLKSPDEPHFDEKLKILSEPSDITLKRSNVEDNNSFDHGNSDKNNNFSFQFITKDKDISEKLIDFKKSFENSLNQITHKKEMPIHIVSKSKESLEILADPEGIGKLNIKLTLQNDSINAKIIAFENVGKEVIERNVLNIIDSLIKEGLNINGFSVSLRHRRDEQSLDQKGDGREERSKEVESKEYKNYIKNGNVSIFI